MDPDAISDSGSWWEMDPDDIERERQAEMDKYFRGAVSRALLVSGEDLQRATEKLKKSFKTLQHDRERAAMRAERLVDQGWEGVDFALQRARRGGEEGCEGVGLKSCKTMELELRELEQAAEDCQQVQEHVAEELQRKWEQAAKDCEEQAVKDLQTLVSDIVAKQVAQFLAGIPLQNGKAEHGSNSS